MEVNRLAYFQLDGCIKKMKNIYIYIYFLKIFQVNIAVSGSCCAYTFKP